MDGPFNAKGERIYPKPIHEGGSGGCFNGNSPSDCLKAGAGKGLSGNFRFGPITVDMPSGLQTPCLQQERRNNMHNVLFSLGILATLCLAMAIFCLSDGYQGIGW